MHTIIIIITDTDLKNTYYRYMHVVHVVHVGVQIEDGLLGLLGFSQMLNLVL